MSHPAMTSRQIQERYSKVPYLTVAKWEDKYELVEEHLGLDLHDDSHNYGTDGTIWYGTVLRHPEFKHLTPIYGNNQSVIVKHLTVPFNKGTSDERRSTVSRFEKEIAAHFYAFEKIKQVYPNQPDMWRIVQPYKAIKTSFVAKGGAESTAFYIAMQNCHCELEKASDMAAFCDMIEAKPKRLFIPNEERHAWVLIHEMLLSIAFSHTVLHMLHMDLRLANFFVRADDYRLMLELSPAPNGHPRLYLGDFGRVVLLADIPPAAHASMFKAEFQHLYVAIQRIFKVFGGTNASARRAQFLHELKSLADGTIAGTFSLHVPSLQVNDRRFFAGNNQTVQHFLQQSYRNEFALQ